MYFLHFFRRTALYGMLTLLVCVAILKVDFTQISHGAVSPDSILGYFYAFMFWSIIVYPLLAALHVIAGRIRCKLKGGTKITAFNSFFLMLRWDLKLPIRNTVTFISIMTKKHIIKDDSAFHNFVDFMEVLVGFIWTVFMAIFIWIGIMYLL